MAGRTWKVVRGVLIGIGAVIVLFGGLLLYLWASGRVWYPRQRTRVEGLSELNLASTPEDDFSVSPLDDALPLNSLRLVASHNSYHLEPDWIRRVLIGLAEPEEPEKLRYSHQTLWDQLQTGVRSFELDVRYRGNRFTITHVPLVDNRGPNPDFALALKEIVTWSQARPDHVPVVVLLELKSDWMFLDPGLKGWDSGALDELDALVRATVPADQLLTPAMVGRGAGALADAVRFLGWPSLGATRGRIMFVVHTDEKIDPLYVAGDPTLSSRPMFTSRPATLAQGESRPDAAVAIHNEPLAEPIAELLARGLVVRTRADGDGSATAEQRAAALRSGAQIVSTDLPPGHPNDPALGQVEFAPGKTIDQVPPR